MESCGETLLRVASDEGEPIDSIEDCRKCCIEHFAAHTVEELERFARDPIVLADDVSPLDGFQFLTENNVRACPVTSADGSSWVGTLDLRDISKLFVESKKKIKLSQQLQALRAAGSSDLEAVSEGAAMSVPPASLCELGLGGVGSVSRHVLEGRLKHKRSRTLDAIAAHPTITTDGASLRYIARMRPFKMFPPKTAITDVARALAFGSHIVGIAKEGGGMAMVVTQKMLFQYVASILSRAQFAVERIMKSPVLSVGCNTSTLDAFQLMVEKNISGLAVTDEEDGTLVHNVSFRDIKMWVAGGRAEEGEAEDADGDGGDKEWTDFSIEDFISCVRRRSAGKARAAVCSSQKEATLAHVIKMLLATGFHHLWVTDSDQHLVGLVSFTDIFRQLCVEV